MAPRVPGSGDPEGDGRGSARSDLRRAVAQAGAESVVDELPKGLETPLGRWFHEGVELSGGQWQKLALARAFMMKPSVLLADEPTGNLDSENGRHVLDLLIRLNKDEGTTLVLVTHDELLASHAERRILLRDGRIVEDK